MALFKDKLYNILPFSIQNFAISVFGYFWKKRRFGGIFNEELQKSKVRDSFNFQEWEEYQNEQLKVILMWAFETVPYYKQSFIEAGLTVADIQQLDIHHMNKIPFLFKNELRKYGKTTLLSHTLEPGGSFFATSGSTGTPSSILYSHSMHQRWNAIFENRGRHWANVSRFDSRGMIGGRRVVPKGVSKGPFYRYNFFEKQVYFSAYHISASTAAMYADAFRKHDIEYMTGYAMSNYFLAKHLKEQNIKVKPLKAVITSSESLTQEMRDIFEEVYGCKTYDTYGSVEACCAITECEHGSLHISPDIGLVEVLNEQNQPCQLGEVGEIVVTSFINFDQPLIRYRIGDMITLSENQECACGRKMPVVKSIAGRIEDTVVGADGRQIVRFHGIFVNIPEIIEGQIIQHTHTNYEVKLVLAAPISKESSTTIVSRMQSQLGEVKVQINPVESIPRTQNGKFKAVISHIK